MFGDNVTVQFLPQETWNDVLAKEGLSSYKGEVVVAGNKTFVQQLMYNKDNGYPVGAITLTDWKVVNNEFVFTTAEKMKYVYKGVVIHLTVNGEALLNGRWRVKNIEGNTYTLMKKASVNLPSTVTLVSMEVRIAGLGLTENTGNNPSDFTNILGVPFHVNNIPMYFKKGSDTYRFLPTVLAKNASNANIYLTSYIKSWGGGTFLVLTDFHCIGFQYGLRWKGEYNFPYFGYIGNDQIYMEGSTFYEYMSYSGGNDGYCTEKCYAPSQYWNKGTKISQSIWRQQEINYNYMSESLLIDSQKKITGQYGDNLRERRTSYVFPAIPEYGFKPLAADKTRLVYPYVAMTETPEFCFHLPGLAVPITYEESLNPDSLLINDDGDEMYYYADMPSTYQKPSQFFPLADKYWKIDDMDNQEWF